MREKDLRSLHWSATRHVRAEAPARLQEAVGALAGHWPEESQVGHKRKLGASNAYGLRLYHRSVEAGYRPQEERTPAAARYLEDVGRQTWGHSMLVTHACKSHIWWLW